MRQGGNCTHTAKRVYRHETPHDDESARCLGLGRLGAGLGLNGRSAGRRSRRSARQRGDSVGRASACRGRGPRARERAARGAHRIRSRRFPSARGGAGGPLRSRDRRRGGTAGHGVALRRVRDSPRRRRRVVRSAASRARGGSGRRVAARSDRRCHRGHAGGGTRTAAGGGQPLRASPANGLSRGGQPTHESDHALGSQPHLLPCLPLPRRLALPLLPRRLALRPRVSAFPWIQQARPPPPSQVAARSSAPARPARGAHHATTSPCPRLRSTRRSPTPPACNPRLAPRAAHGQQAARRCQGFQPRARRATRCGEALAEDPRLHPPRHVAAHRRRKPSGPRRGKVCGSSPRRPPDPAKCRRIHPRRDKGCASSPRNAPDPAKRRRIHSRQHPTGPAFAASASRRAPPTRHRQRGFPASARAAKPARPARPSHTRQPGR